MSGTTEARIAVRTKTLGGDVSGESSPIGNEGPAVVRLPGKTMNATAVHTSERDVERRWLPAGDPRSLPRLDAEAAGRNAAGEDVQVVYSARGDRFVIVPRAEVTV